MDSDNVRFLTLVAALVQRRGWRLWAYCLMPNHYHVLATTPAPDLSAGMHWLNGTYARWFNDSHGLNGHVFQARFYAAPVGSQEHLLESIRYIVRNPVRARLCRHPWEWRWSSYRTIALARRTSLVDGHRTLSLFGGRAADARQAFRAFVADGRLEARSA